MELTVSWNGPSLFVEDVECDPVDDRRVERCSVPGQRNMPTGSNPPDGSRGGPPNAIGGESAGCRNQGCPV